MLKDEGLVRLAEGSNVAQFVSFGPGPGVPQRHARVRGCEPDCQFSSPRQAVAELLERSVPGTVNVRSYHPDNPMSRDFAYGLATVDEVVSLLHRHASRDLYTIVNETIDVHDAGVSGVVLGRVAEFAPDDTPRCVEKPGVARMDHSIAMRVLQTVYGFEPDLGYRPDERVEFSIHPVRVGFRQTHTIVWEIERVGPVDLSAKVVWPNRFSRMMGDKAFGLLVADTVGLPVPSTIVVGRRLAPFSFGQPTGTAESWLRTCPTEQVPGRFTTSRGWQDPFALLQREDPEGDAIASVLAQEGVEARFSGATVPQVGAADLVEGIAGGGEAFMQGRSGPGRLPEKVVEDVRDVVAQVRGELGAVRLEWVHDGHRAWVVQLHLVGDRAVPGVIYPGEARTWHRFHAEDGLDVLRKMIAEVGRRGDGIVVDGNVGITSHVGDMLRKARIPARLASPEGHR